VDLVADDGRRRARAGAADAHLRITVHRAVDRDRIAHARFDDADGDADQALGRRAAAVDVGVEIEPDAEIGRDVRGEGRVVERVAQHAVDVGRGHAGIGHGIADRPARERAGGLVRAAAVAGLADAADGVLPAQMPGGRGLDLRCRGQTHERLPPERAWPGQSRRSYTTRPRSRPAYERSTPAPGSVTIALATVAPRPWPLGEGP
jgi:hypothetical protein